MTWRKRIDRLEGGKARPANDPEALTALAEALDRMAAREVTGCATVQRELSALVAPLEGSDNGNAAKAT